MTNLLQIVIYVILASSFIAGLINAVFPRFLWEKFESWKAKQQPSKAFFFSRRIKGLLTMLMSAFMLYLFSGKVFINMY